MSESRTSAGWMTGGLAVTLAVLVLLLVVYVWGYFALSYRTTTRQSRSGYYYYRLYNEEWQAVISRPAAWVESKLTGCKVEGHTEVEEL